MSVFLTFMWLFALSDEEIKEYNKDEAKMRSFFTGTWNSTKDKYNPQVKLVF